MVNLKYNICYDLRVVPTNHYREECFSVHTGTVGWPDRAHNLQQNRWLTERF